jgi:two-component system, chemotaxis family, sensor kinase CheA
MSIDMSQFHDVFFEESFEGLEIMENGLLDLNQGEPDVDAINTIFRAAHSIKGGSGTFGFKEVSDFTHVMETLLDEMREGQRDVTQQAVNLLLESVDCLREMLTATRESNELDMESIAVLQTDLEAMLAGSDAAVTDSSSAPTTSPSTTMDVDDSGLVHQGWHINFKPHLHMLKTGNDPVRMFRELSELGELDVKVDTSSLPEFSDCDPEECYVSWELELKSDANRDQIDEIFEWVDGDCDLEITETNSTTTETAAPVEATVIAGGDDRRSSQVRRQKDEPVQGPDKRVSADRRKGDRKAKSSGDTSIRVSIDKVDALINLVGELVITQSMLTQFGESVEINDLEKLRDGLGQLERNTRELQENVMQIRMLPISFSFNRFPRLVHDLSGKLNKKIELKVSGEQTELDKTVMEKIGDPLVHLVRNSLDHGIEMPEQRKAAGKPETGILHLNAYHEGGNIVIDITDDGAGLNTEKIRSKAIERGLIREDEHLTDSKIHDLVFRPGFSTADQVSDVSGRGVGMDVVRRNIHDLGGVVEVKSESGKGSTFTIRLPLTLAIVDGQLVRVGDQIYIIPLISIIESLQIKSENVKTGAGQTELYRLREDYIPMVRLHNIFHTKSDSTQLDDGLLVVVEAEGQKVGFFVDDLLAQHQVVVKSLESNYQRVVGVSGATILGDGTVAMILDISGLINLSRPDPDGTHINNFEQHQAA